jgi:hypothetical protein
MTKDSETVRGEGALCGASTADVAASHILNSLPCFAMYFYHAIFFGESLF